MNSAAKLVLIIFMLDRQFDVAVPRLSNGFDNNALLISQGHVSASGAQAYSLRYGPADCKPGMPL